MTRDEAVRAIVRQALDGWQQRMRDAGITYDQADVVAEVVASAVRVALRDGRAA